MAKPPPNMVEIGIAKHQIRNLSRGGHLDAASRTSAEAAVSSP
jgi:hypothetical protein